MQRLTLYHPSGNSSYGYKAEQISYEYLYGVGMRFKLKQAWIVENDAHKDIEIVTDLNYIIQADGENDSL